MKKSVFAWALPIAMIAALTACQQDVKTPVEQDNSPKQVIEVTAYNFAESDYMTAHRDDPDTNFLFKIVPFEGVAFNQSGVHQRTAEAQAAPKADAPYFNVEIALPTPPAYVARFAQPRDLGELAGLDHGVYYHNHSAGMEVLPNGDVLAVYFSTPAGLAEADPRTTFIQARLRNGSLEWDMPELFFETHGYNDQSALLWRNGEKLYFFGGGRKISDWVPFRVATSTDNGAHWTFIVPQLDKPATDYTAQPISNGFADPDGNIYFPCDADGSQSFLWRSSDEGIHWTDMGGRTGGRHSTIVPLDDQGHLLSIGGKNANVDGWTPQNESSDWGATWTESVASPFPQLGSAQRPCMIRLASGNLLLVTDSYLLKYNIPAPESWEMGGEPVVAISKDNGKTWRMKNIPYGLPHNNPTRSTNSSLGYVTLRQGDNGLIHVLTTANANNLHFTFNEAWIWSDAETDWAPKTNLEGGQLKKYKEYYLNKKGKRTGKLKSTWSARIMPDGSYLLDGEMKDYYEDGTLQHSVTYAYGRKTGREDFWGPDGQLMWHWDRNLETNVGTMIRYWPNGVRKVVSNWNLLPTARDRDRQYIGYVANGQAVHWDEEGHITGQYVFENGRLVENFVEEE